jgi:phospholipid/cholesterol/gamma-HCH transport system permease protein
MGGLILFLVENLTQTLLIDKNVLGSLMSQIVLRELAPLFTSIIVIGRSATAVATEIGNMKVNHEIEALETLGIDPIHYLAAPRIIGMTVSLIFLVLYFFFIALIGGYLFSNIFFNIQLPFDEYIGIVFEKMELRDIGISMLKSFFFGLFISAIACYKGLKIEKSITFVPVVATQTVVSSMTAVFFFYAYFTIIFLL